MNLTINVYTYFFENRLSGNLVQPNTSYGSELLVLVSNLLATFVQFTLSNEILVEVER